MKLVKSGNLDCSQISLYVYIICSIYSNSCFGNCKNKMLYNDLDKAWLIHERVIWIAQLSYTSLSSSKCCLLHTFEWINSVLLLGKPHGADDFLPVLMYVLARSDLTEMILNVEYMMELMDPALQLGEGMKELQCIDVMQEWPVCRPHEAYPDPFLHTHPRSHQHV